MSLAANNVALILPNYEWCLWSYRDESTVENYDVQISHCL